MLKKFSVKNFRGFIDEICFDFTAKAYEFNQQIIKNGLVNKAIVYGKNGIGKSNIGEAIFDIIYHFGIVHFRRFFIIKRSDEFFCCKISKEIS